MESNITKLFGCMGFPRGGTHYVSKLMRAIGFDVAHEAMGKDGICDSRLVLLINKMIDPDDSNLVFSMMESDSLNDQRCVFLTKELMTKFEVFDYTGEENVDVETLRLLIKKIIEINYNHKLLFIRNPWHTISTWSQLYNYPYGSGMIPDYIYFSKTLETYQFENTFHRSCEVWNEYTQIMMNSGDATIRLENIYEDLNKFFEENNLKNYIFNKNLLDSIKKQGITPFHRNRITEDEIRSQVPEDSYIKVKNLEKEIYDT